LQKRKAELKKEANVEENDTVAGLSRDGAGSDFGRNSHFSFA